MGFGTCKHANESADLGSQAWLINLLSKTNIDFIQKLTINQYKMT
ncbi:hypothetical protein GPAL_2070 [Glaciecola pallidula DSM 14239 = ACAM 615]|uniref:Uncharacterized protein n=1 Tax=Brumicola pallidula DSM 14239 = ACAM 615 TaxID=1121922 RepID=K6YYA2_9ALTE|nr:hypothetical protein GPAL_2070 [Glaciecola pallidula DSM 14239 = ACAM 615]